MRRRFPVVANSPREEGVAVLDARSAAHFGVGAAAGMLGVHPVLVILLALGYESAVEVWRQQDAAALTRRRPGESCINQFADIVLTVAGVYSGAFVRSTMTLPTTQGLGALGCAGGCKCGGGCGGHA
jgi:hypothetical protein